MGGKLETTHGHKVSSQTGLKSQNFWVLLILINKFFFGGGREIEVHVRGQGSQTPLPMCNCDPYLPKESIQPKSLLYNNIFATIFVQCIIQAIAKNIM